MTTSFDGENTYNSKTTTNNRWRPAPMIQYSNFKRISVNKNKTLLRKFTIRSRKNFFRNKSDLDFIKNMAEVMWSNYDIDQDNALNKKEAKCFVNDIMSSVSTQFDQSEFNRVFKEMDADGNGMIEKDEMVQFLTKILMKVGEGDDSF